MTSQQPLDPHALGRVHFIGMGGVGMSAVARLLLARGVPVSGSDAKDSAGLRELEELGATVFVGQDASNVSGAATVVVSTAIRESNPELAAARAAGLRVLHRSEALAAAMHGRHVIAVAGTHGKTTTSSMTAVALRTAGLDPSWAIGAFVADLGANAGFGDGDWFVAEADESDGSFMAYHPRIAVVTNVEPDHLDHYGSAEAFHRAFDEFSDTVREGGTLVACVDDPGVARLARRRRELGAAVLTYGTDGSADVHVSQVRPAGTGATCRLSFPAGEGRREVELALAVPGAHNVADAAAAFAAGLAAGGDPELLLAGLGQFHGSARRFDLKGEEGSVRVFDDYAHHPTEVAAALGAARDVAQGHRVLAVFQPHLYSRTREFAEPFCRALELADLACVTDVFGAREQPEPGITGATITGHARDARVVSTPTMQEAVAAVVERAEPGDVVMTVGAGDVTALGPQLLAALARR
ncbi:UDP-N-acetylmuramate--L-alanine ligase [Kocuria tytonicola]|uniref:UDP-N-acetylmuramate--L-alanine ligase n=1 Tax=Kocuria tytonicola TaxID=2055946 RepID=UPI000EF8726C|nr:UDP-N-acetylmuramate--L-alanine ligase [Kocuria tytonicola]RLZ02734.1 UDP-N-acetylmuramate--L-alanine ligase [Kocuria tytonicola]